MRIGNEQHWRFSGMAKVHFYARCLTLVAACGLVSAFAEDALPESTRVLYNNPGVIVDLGVGLWAQPIPMDFDGDGRMDLLAASADRPYNGVYLFKKRSGSADDSVFSPGVRLTNAQHNITVSHTDYGVHVLTPGRRYPDFTNSLFDNPVSIPYRQDFSVRRARAQQWNLEDYNGNGALDLVIGIGEWAEYGWDDAWDSKGEWMNGPLRGHVYVVLNQGTNDEPVYEKSMQLMVGDAPLEVFGAPSPSFGDWDGDGDLDLICGEFLDKLTYFENIGTRTAPVYAPGRYLEMDGHVLHMDLQMLQVTSVDWTGNGLTDLVVGEEDGRVALLEFTGEMRNGLPKFLPPRFFRQEAHELKVGALSTPYSYDWDGDGFDDLIVGDTAGYISFVKNLDGGNPPSWAKPVYLDADGEIIRIQAGSNGSIQGPAEAKWGYTVLNVADWNHDGLPDIVINSIWGKVMWFENVGTRTEPKLRAAQPIAVAWESWTPKPPWTWWTPEGKELVTQWRTTPCVLDLNGNGLNDLVMLDQEGYLAFFERQRRDGELILLPPRRIFMDEHGQPLRLNNNWAGGSGRRKLAFVDWDGDGRLDILINSRSVDFLRNIGTATGEWVFRNDGLIDRRELGGHSTSPAVVDWNRDGIPDLIIGAEDGFFYHLENPRSRAER